MASLRLGAGDKGAVGDCRDLSSALTFGNIWRSSSAATPSAVVRSKSVRKNIRKAVPILPISRPHKNLRYSLPSRVNVGFAEQGDTRAPPTCHARSRTGVCSLGGPRASTLPGPAYCQLAQGTKPFQAASKSRFSAPLPQFNGRWLTDLQDRVILED